LYLSIFEQPARRGFFRTLLKGAEVSKVGRTKPKENPTTKARKLENTKKNKWLKLENIEIGVVE
jgi:hypothetical protein